MVPWHLPSPTLSLSLSSAPLHPGRPCGVQKWGQVLRTVHLQLLSEMWVAMGSWASEGSPERSHGEDEENRGDV